MEKGITMGIEEINQYYEKFGLVRYFRAGRCFNGADLREFNKGKITANELVTFDCGLLELEELEKPDVSLLNKGEQLLAVIVRPEMDINPILEDEQKFEFCGYDLVEIETCISAITNCGAEFNSVKYENLNKYGLISTYREAVNTGLDLREEAPYESHAYCEVVEIWRMPA